MITNYIKTTVRGMRRHKGYTFLNLAGLAMGLACSIIVALYVQFELSFDQYHANKARLYRLATSIQGAGFGAIAKVNGPWGPSAKDEFPEIDETARFVIHEPAMIVYREKRILENGGLYADSSVFSVFSWKMLKGNPATALSRPNSIVMTKDLASKYFGTDDPLDKTVSFGDGEQMKVAGVMENVPPNSHFSFTFLVSMASLSHPDKDDWLKWNQFYTYLLLKQGAQPSSVEEKLPELLKRHMGSAAAPYKPFLQPITSIRLHSNLFREMQPNSSISTVLLMAASGFFLLLIGCINFINLSTARASKRAKEVGVRKVAGADRAMLSRQFISESIFLTLIAFVVALAIAEAVLPFFNTLANSTLSFGAADWRFFVAIVSLALLVGIGAGTYPAFVLSGFRPVEVLKGVRKTSGGIRLRKSLVVFQFAVSVFFLVATGIVFEQLKFIQAKSPGFNQEQLVTIPLRNQELRDRTQAIKFELANDQNVLSVSASAAQPSGGDWGIPVEIEGIPGNQGPPIRVLAVDPDFIPTFQMEMAEGRNFSKERATDTSAFIINEEAARELGWGKPLEQRIGMSAMGRLPSPVIGVVKDFHFRSMHEKIGPVLLFIPPSAAYSLLTVRLRPGHIDEGLKSMERKWSSLNPNEPFSYTFFDEQFARFHVSERRMGTLLTFLCGLAVFIACLGLFGLAAYSADQRTKEIGVRKVLGASVFQVVGLLSREFMSLVIVAVLAAWPIAYYVMNEWLDGFAYRTHLNVTTFVLAGGAAVLVAILTVSYQSINASLRNPVESLRYE